MIKTHLRGTFAAGELIWGALRHISCSAPNPELPRWLCSDPSGSRFHHFYPPERFVKIWETLCAQKPCHMTFTCRTRVASQDFWIETENAWGRWSWGVCQVETQLVKGAWLWPLLIPFSPFGLASILPPQKGQDGTEMAPSLVASRQDCLSLETVDLLHHYRARRQTLHGPWARVERVLLMKCLLPENTWKKNTPNLLKHILYTHLKYSQSQVLLWNSTHLFLFLYIPPCLPDTENAGRKSSHPMTSVKTAHETGLVKYSGPLLTGRVEWPSETRVSFTERSVTVSGVSGSCLEWELNGCHWHERKHSLFHNYCYGYVLIKSSHSHQNMDVLDGIKCQNNGKCSFECLGDRQAFWHACASRYVGYKILLQ